MWLPGLAPLKASKAFRKASLVEGEGWTVEWEVLDIQIVADTLWLEAQAQNAPDENTRVFASCRATHGWWREWYLLCLSANSRLSMAAFLGFSLKTVRHFYTASISIGK